MKRLSGIGLRITNFCFNRCRICATKSTASSRETSISREQARSYLRQVRGSGGTTVSLTGGEPLTHPQVAEMVGDAIELGFAEVQLVTGGWLPSFSAQRRSQLTEIITLFKDTKTDFEICVSFTPFVQRGIQNLVETHWQTTLADLMSIGGLLKQQFGKNCVSINYVDRYPQDRSRAFDELVERFKGQREEGGLICFPEAGIEFAVDRAPVWNTGLATKGFAGLLGSNYCASFIPTPTGILDSLFMMPVIDPSGMLFPCASVFNGTAPATSAINVNGNNNELITGIDKYVGLKEKLISLREEVFAKMKEGDSFCLACIQARIELLAA